LARKARFRWKRFAGEPFNLVQGARSGLTRPYLDAAGRAASIPAATVQNVNARVLDSQHEAFSVRGLKWLFSFDMNRWHSSPF
jgi:hypothetical protein